MRSEQRSRAWRPLRRRSHFTWPAVQLLRSTWDTGVQMISTGSGGDDIAHLVMALAYFDDAERQRMPSLIRKVPWKTMKAEIQRWVRTLG
jgi:hypothetical protein